MRCSLLLLPLLLMGCSRAIVSEEYYAPDEIEIVVELSDSGERWVVPAVSGGIDDWSWSWQERYPKLVEARSSAPDGAATQARVSFASAPIDPDLPTITISEAAVDRGFRGKWRVKLRLSYRDARAGATWTQRLRLDADEQGRWKVDLGPNPLTGLPHHAVVTVQDAGSGAGTGAS